MAIGVLIALNGVFVAAEFALVATDRSRLQRRAEAGSRRARLALGLLGRLPFHLSGAQLGITITSLVVGFTAEPTIGRALAPLVEPVVGQGASVVVTVALAFVLATGTQMVVGELIPKGYATARPDRTTVALAPALRAYGTVFAPVIWVLDGAARAVVRLLGMAPREELSHVRSLPELDLVVAASAQEGTLRGSASALLARSIRFGAKTVGDALVPRPDVVAVPWDETASGLVARSAASGHSRFPVTGADLDDVRGVVHVRAVHGVPPAERDRTPVTELMAEALVVPETRALTEVLADMRGRRQHLAVVVDEYGGTAGIVTLEDVVEEIVGEIDDEHDVPAAALSPGGGGGPWVLAGGLHRDEVRDACGFAVPEGGFDTLAGFVLASLGRVPAVGERFDHDGWRFEVAAMDRHRVAEVVVTAPAAAAGPEVGEGRP